MDSSEKTKKSVGRPAHEIDYKEVVYGDKEYIVGTVITKGTPLKFVIDKEDYSKIKDYTWHHVSNSYIGHTIPVDDKRRELYLHNMVMNRIAFPGKGTRESVDHINRNGLDNRKENLRIVSQTEQNINQTKKKRIIVLPEDSGIKADDLPKHIWYVRANGSHGDRFAIELKTEGISWKTTSSRTVSLKDKLDAAKAKLAEYYETYPYLNPDNDEKMTEVRNLTASYNAIIGLAEEAATGTA